MGYRTVAHALLNVLRDLSSGHCTELFWFSLELALADQSGFFFGVCEKGIRLGFEVFEALYC